MDGVLENKLASDHFGRSIFGITCNQVVYIEVLMQLTKGMAKCNLWNQPRKEILGLIDFYSERTAIIKMFQMKKHVVQNHGATSVVNLVCY